MGDTAAYWSANNGWYDVVIAVYWLAYHGCNDGSDNQSIGWPTMAVTMGVTAVYRLAHHGCFDGDAISLLVSLPTSESVMYTAVEK